MMNKKIGLLVAIAFLAVTSAGSSGAVGAQTGPRSGVVTLTNDDFRFGTYVIDRPGTYRLGEDISFNPNAPAALQSFVNGDVGVAHALGLTLPIDAYQAGFPLRTQFVSGSDEPFSPGGPLDARYDPAAYGVGFFAAVSITADDVILDLAGHRIEQSAEHALLQRFFSVIELADQPFLPSQGPSDFGTGIDSARHVTIRNGTIGRSSHHGIHGNGNEDVRIRGIAFVDYEVGAVALNGVTGLEVADVTATNRKDVPVLGTFSSAQFIKHYVDELVRTEYGATLSIGEIDLTATQIQAALRDAINTTHADVLATGAISPRHETAYGLFHNVHRVIDGNSYSFLVNPLGVAVGGFPTAPTSGNPASDVRFTNVHVIDQVAAINEVPAIDVGGTAAIDPVGAVFQTQNRGPNGVLVTISDDGRYLGNPVANAQALVAKAKADGAFNGSHLDVSRLNISDGILDWVESDSTLADSGLGYLCNGDSMFHVNKGAIAFRIDGVLRATLRDTSVAGLRNLGPAGSELCGPYLGGFSHPGATLPGYGGSMVRAYSFAGSRDVSVDRAVATALETSAGSIVGFDVLTDSSNMAFTAAQVRNTHAGPVSAGTTTAPATEHGFHVGVGATEVTITGSCSTTKDGFLDGTAVVRGNARGC